METATLAMTSALMAMLGTLLAMTAVLFLKMANLGRRMERIEAKVDTFSLFVREHAHDRDTGQAVAPVPVEAD